MTHNSDTVEIRRCLESIGQSTHAVARVTGISPRTIRHYKAGTRSPLKSDLRLLQWLELGWQYRRFEGGWLDLIEAQFVELTEKAP